MRDDTFNLPKFYTLAMGKQTDKWKLYTESMVLFSVLEEHLRRLYIIIEYIKKIESQMNNMFSKQNEDIVMKIYTFILEQGAKLPDELSDFENNFVKTHSDKEVRYSISLVKKLIKMNVIPSWFEKEFAEINNTRVKIIHPKKVLSIRSDTDISFNEVFKGIFFINSNADNLNNQLYDFYCKITKSFTIINAEVMNVFSRTGDLLLSVDQEGILQCEIKEEDYNKEQELALLLELIKKITSTPKEG